MENFDQHAGDQSVPPLWFGGLSVRAATLKEAKLRHLAGSWPLMDRVEPVILAAVTRAINSDATDRLFNYRFARTWVQDLEALRSQILAELESPIDSAEQQFTVKTQVEILLAGTVGTGLSQELLDAYAGHIAWLESQPSAGTHAADHLLSDPDLNNLIKQLEGQANYARYELDSKVSERGLPALPKRLLWDQEDQTPYEVVVGTTPERVELARRTYRSVSWKITIIMLTLVAVILVAGIYLAGRGEASLLGVFIVSGVFLAMIWVYWWMNRREVLRAQRFLSQDGATQFRVTPHAITVGDTVIPLEQVTGVFFNLDLEIYSSGGITELAMSRRLHLSEDNIMGNAVGARMGTKMRARMYREGAKSWAQMTLGVENRDSIATSTFEINPMRTLPNSKLGRGRIDVPVGAYLTRDDLVVLFEALEQSARTFNFPIGVTSGDLNWAQAQTMLSTPREQIWEESSQVLVKRQTD